ncbi:hypothetical protein QFC21_001491 [Naganishia friedmannii]|uniref:Uncharacterized protein n=1 Tax=Naganishia friedmannii TaxID=89922 RepID=A0ACC2W3N6_9TREE|nr:hypothetical protein QFC21_001491 [Naganishia friedmannii]
MGVLEKIQEIETLKAKLAKYRAQLLEPDKKAGGKGEGFDVLKSGGIVEGAAMGRGRGRQVVSVAKTADVIVIMTVVDATKSNEQRRLLETELEAVGIRLNTKAPDVVFRQKAAGGINATVKLNHIDEKMIRTILQSYKIHNCDVMIREDIDTDEFIDVLLGTRKYIPCLYVFNKIDSVSLEEVERLSTENEGRNVMISCELDLGLDILLERIWEELRLVKYDTSHNK